MSMTLTVNDWVSDAPSITWNSVNAKASTPCPTVPGYNAEVNFGLYQTFPGKVGDYVYGLVFGSNNLAFNTAEFVVESITTAPAIYTLVITNVGDAPGTIYGFPKALISNPNELPAGRMGTYGNGRVWMSLTDGISFIGGDLVGSSSGTLNYNFRDAVLRVTQNVSLAGGVTFRIPDSADTIRAMAFVAQLDVSLGNGPLQVFTDRNIFGCDAPIDASTWAALTNPIVTVSLKGSGGRSQNAVVPTNSDIIFRSDGENIRSLLMARLDFNKWGNTPISKEMVRFLVNDDPTLLVYSSAIQFDNRMLMTCFPVQSGSGIFHRGILSLNFDSISGLQGKAPSIWEGIWTGVQALQLVQGSFGGTERAFAFVQDSPCGAIQLYEFLPESTDVVFDSSDYGDARITWGIETPDLFRGSELELVNAFKALEDGELAIDQAFGPITITVLYRADQSPNWYPWRTINLFVEDQVTSAQKGYFPRVHLGKPDELMVNDGLSSRNARYGYTFQIKLVITGNCRILGGRLKASRQPEPEFGTPGV